MRKHGSHLRQVLEHDERPLWSLRQAQVWEHDERLWIGRTTAVGQFQ